MREILAMEEDFPERLREIPDSPKCIYLIGNLPEKKGWYYRGKKRNGIWEKSCFESCAGACRLRYRNS